MSQIKVKCEGCKKLHEICSTDFDFEEVGAEEREMGPEIAYEGNYEFQCECEKKIEITHRFWEYPVGAENYKETEVSGAAVIENEL
ncbi:MAG TPA: hypothetical protein VFH71_10870 [Rhodanobacteraceae bacterium]|nr:hypothetical protein [Rhodanobacteraceae bacterium]